MIWGILMTLAANSPYQSRRELRAVVWEISGGDCEHPVKSDGQLTACGVFAAELAHLRPRGMGHTGYRDTINNCIAACGRHARSTDDLSDEAWVEIGMDRIGLTEWVRDLRLGKGWDV